MPDSKQDLLARLAGRSGEPGADPWAAVAATQPKHEKAASAEKGADVKLDQLVARIANLVGDSSVAKAPPPTSEPSRTETNAGGIHSDPLRAEPVRPGSVRAEPVHSGPIRAAPNFPPPPPVAAAGAAEQVAEEFVPLEPRSLKDSGLTIGEIEALILKFLLNIGTVSGRAIAEQVKLPFSPMEELLREMKQGQLLVHKQSAPMNDYIYQLTDLGRERARRQNEHCTYFGAAPVPLKDYIASVEAQSIAHQHPTKQQLEFAFRDLLLNKRMLNRLGPAVNSGRGLFLFGAPGNGKTSIAERVTRAFGETVWIPRAIGIDGDIIRMYDPATHEDMPTEGPEGVYDSRHIDQRWVRIRRPTIVVGGELTMDSLEVTLNHATGIAEAPLQMKSNTGTLVIDDFGRQKMRVDELLNRWIVPLEKRYDYLNLPSGKKIQVPFDQLIIFSTNLEPKDLVDDALLRRIPYKIEVPDPSEEEFRQLMRIMADKLDIPFRDDALNYLVEKHYKAVKRPFRCCHPRDLLMQIKNTCHYLGSKPEMSTANFDAAVENYFAIM